MDTNQKKERRLAFALNKSTELLLGVGLIIIIIVILLFFLLNRNNLNNEQNPNSYPLTSLMLTSNKVLEVTDPKKVTIDEKSIELSGEWRVITALRDFSLNNDLKCQDVEQTECTAYYLVNGVEEGNYYISTPTPLRVNSGIPTEVEEKTINISGIDYRFIYQKLKLISREGESQDVTENTTTKIYLEVYACVADQLCVSSGPLNILDENKNKEEVQKFENFLKSLKVS